MWTLTASGQAPTPGEEAGLYQRLAEVLASLGAGTHLALFHGSHVSGSPHLPPRREDDDHGTLAGLGR